MELHGARFSTCRTGAALALGLGALGMLASLVYLDSPVAAHVIAGTCGFVAGAILIGAGLIAMALLERDGAATEPVSRPRAASGS